MARTKGTDDLYRLIHSLTKEEKGYFKKFAKRHGEEDSNLLLLFEAINAQTEFEEGSLKKKFKTYARMKVYLFGMITDALSLYIGDGSVNLIDMLKLYLRAAVLEQKGMLPNAGKLYKTGAALAQDTSYPLFNYHFNKELLRVQGINSNMASFKAGEQLMDEMVSVLDKELLNVKFEHEVKKLKAFLLQEIGGKKDALKSSDIDFELLLNRDTRLSPYKRAMGDEALITYYTNRQQYQNAFDLAKLHLQAISKKGADKFEPNTYSRALMHYAMVCSYIGEYVDGHVKLEAMHAIKTENKTVQKAIAHRYVNYKLLMYCRSGDLKSGVTFWKNALASYPEVGDANKPIHYYAETIGCALYLQFFAKQHQQCIYTLNNVNMTYIQQHMPLTYRDIELLWLMLQVEFGNYTVLGDMLRSTTARLKKAEVLDDYIKLLLGFFKEVVKHGKNARRDYYVQAMHKLAQPNLHSFMGIRPFHEYVAEVNL